MSAKWRRVKAWDDAHLTGGLTPIRWVLRAFSSITLAVILLIAVAIYGTLASVPLGLMALAPTWLFYVATLLAVIAAVVVPPVWVINRVTRSRLSPGARFAMLLPLSAALLAAGAWGWSVTVWPAIRYIPGEGGVQFFSAYVEQYKSVPMRQLPSWEMSELEFYAWWPLKVILLTFVVNMIVATIRRIELRWLNIGVLTVHTGIVTLALGSVLYSMAKVEGDIILSRAAEPGQFGEPATGFYDNLETAIYAARGRGGDSGRWVMVELPHLARYNPAPAGTPYAPDYPLHQHEVFQQEFTADLEARVVGMIPYAREVSELRDGGNVPAPSLHAEMTVDDPSGGEARTIWRSDRLVGQSAPRGTAHMGDFTVQHLVIPTQRRMNDLTAEFPEPADHLLIVRVPGGEEPFEVRYAVAPGDRIPVGETGWTIAVERYQASDEGLSLVSEGYRGAASSRIILNVTGPEGEAFQRHVLHRYPELTQDFTPGAQGQPPNRTAPDRAIDIAYIDATRAHFFIVQPDLAEPLFDIVRREPGGGVHLDRGIRPGQSVSGGAFDRHPVALRVTDYWARTFAASSFVAVPREEQDRRLRGDYSMAALDLEVSARLGDGSMWSRRLWLPFNKYLEGPIDADAREVDIPGYGPVTFAFSRLRRQFPGFALALADFEMIPYPGTDIPRDYVSSLVVLSAENPEGEVHETRLNRPYIHVVESSRQEGLAGSAIGAIRQMLLPNQFKFSQAGWDPQNQAFTILGVGNNPGIRFIAIGGILMGIGIPIAFYVKPAILRAQKRRIQQQMIEQPTGDDGSVARPAQSGPPTRPTTQKQPTTPSGSAAR